jgi:hypothetical protein
MSDKLDTITLGDWVIPLRAKGGASATWDIVQLGAAVQTRNLGYAAALGFMWENTTNPRYPLRARYKQMGRRWADYGAAVIDELIAKGIPMGEVYAAGALAWYCMYDASALFPKEEEVVAAVGN